MRRMFSEKQVEKLINDNATCLYRHHFNVHIDAQNFGGTGVIVIPVNALSTSPDPWQTLEELDGNGFIVSAFGYVEIPTPDLTFIYEINLFYKALNNGTLLMTARNVADSMVYCGTVNNYNSYALEDSVTKL